MSESARTKERAKVLREAAELAAKYAQTLEQRDNDEGALALRSFWAMLMAKADEAEDEGNTEK